MLSSCMCQPPQLLASPGISEASATPCRWASLHLISVQSTLLWESLNQRRCTFWQAFWQAIWLAGRSHAICLFKASSRANSDWNILQGEVLLTGPGTSFAEAMAVVDSACETSQSNSSEQKLNLEPHRAALFTHPAVQATGKQLRDSIKNRHRVWCEESSGNQNAASALNGIHVQVSRTSSYRQQHMSLCTQQQQQHCESSFGCTVCQQSYMLSILLQALFSFCCAILSFYTRLGHRYIRSMIILAISV